MQIWWLIGRADDRLLTINLQIRIVKDIHDEEGDGDGTKKKKKKKSHRGYAFIVYEREKDMKGTAFPIFLLTA